MAIYRKQNSINCCSTHSALWVALRRRRPHLFLEKLRII